MVGTGKAVSWGDLDDGSWREGSKRLHRQAVEQTTFSFAASSQRLKTSLATSGGGAGLSQPKKVVTFSTATPDMMEVSHGEGSEGDAEEGAEDEEDGDEEVAATPEELEQAELLREFSLRR
eukprot:COSAG05_NODE_124_length_17559_cov_8.898643_2_plen_121_part_00